MKPVAQLAFLAMTAYGAVTLIQNDHMGWAITSFFLPPIAWVHGIGHLAGAW